jgi:ABC-type phosphate transport system permease subunit
MAYYGRSFLASKGLGRMAVVVIFLWIIIWGYVGWRGLSIIHDAKQFISAQPPGALIPEEILDALDSGQSYVLRAAIFGIAVPIGLLIVYWICTGFRRSSGG